MKEKTMKAHTIFLFTALSLGLLALSFLDVFIGSVHIPPLDIIKSIGGTEINESYTYILRNFRTPKLITALIAGTSLSLAGLQMQTLFRNPLAGPYVLGISSGASLGVALYVLTGGLFSLSFIGLAANWGMALFAIAGAFLVLFLVIIVSIRITDTVSLLIVGIMFGSITGALVNILQYFSSPGLVHNFLVWTFGSLSSVSWNEIYIILPLVLIGILISIAFHKPLDAFLLGENYARGIGISVTKSRLFIIISTSLLAGTPTAFTGPIAFIGVAVPHIARALFRTSDHKVLIPAVALIGSLLMVICDILSQLPGSQNSLPINSMTALFGAPVVIWVIIRSKKYRSGF